MREMRILGGGFFTFSFAIFLGVLPWVVYCLLAPKSDMSEGAAERIGVSIHGVYVPVIVWKRKKPVTDRGVRNTETKQGDLF